MNDPQFDQTLLQHSEVFAELRDLFQLMATQGKETVSPNAFFEAVGKRKPRYRDMAQQDAEEFLRDCLQMLREDIQEIENQDHIVLPPCIDNVFRFNSLVTLQCPDCQRRREHAHEELTLKLYLPLLSESDNTFDQVCAFLRVCLCFLSVCMCSLQWDLISLVSRQTRESSRDFRCQCQAKTVTSLTSFESLPQMLAIHVSRRLADGTKRHASIELKPVLNLEQFIVHSNETREQLTMVSGNGRKRRGETNPTEKRRRVAAEFQLWAVVFHKGGTGLRGHYTVTVLNNDGEWEEHDDATVVKKQELPHFSRTAYLLFYQRA